MPRRVPRSAPHRSHPARLCLLAAVPVLTPCREDSNPQAPHIAPPPPELALTPGATAVLVGAGDIASCSSTGDEQTAQLLRGIAGTVFTAGDNASPNGSSADYKNCYTPTWGTEKARTRPAPGDVEYNTKNAAGYFNYFGGAAGQKNKGYYSYDLGAWHIVVLNSNLNMSTGSAQEVWLKNDLAASTAQCKLAYWHLPRFFSGVSTIRSALKPVWDDLYAAGVELVINAHSGNYERFAPQTPDGVADPTNGIREIIVGTGGLRHFSFGSIAQNSEVRDNTSSGVLKLTLNDGSYTWEFIPIPGDPFVDSGSGACHSFFSSRRRHTRFDCDWSSDVCSSDLLMLERMVTSPKVNVISWGRLAGLRRMRSMRRRSRWKRWIEPPITSSTVTPKDFSSEIGRASCRERV